MTHTCLFTVQDLDENEIATMLKLAMDAGPS